MPGQRPHDKDPAHDVLAAEEFGLPAPRGGATVSGPQPRLGSRRTLLAAAALALLATRLLHKRRT